MFPNTHESIPYHICVITAANEYQAEGYRKQLEWRKDRDMLPEETEFLVIPDPHGKRIGSGGSTIYVLYKLLERLCNPTFNIQHLVSSIQNKRILILHSGGDSKRLPAYSAIGKLFTPLPACKCANHSIKDTDGFVTLFDLFIHNLIQLPTLKDGQMVIASGDVLLSFDPSQVTFSENGVTGVAYPGSVDVASNHGVYVVPKGLAVGNRSDSQLVVPVFNFLQKPTYDELKKNNGLDVAERAFVDTGIMNFSLDAIKILIEASGISIRKGQLNVEKGSLCESLINGDINLDIYKEIPFAILEKEIDDNEAFLSKSHFKDTLRGIPFYVSLLSYCEFFHVGESKQLLQNFHTISYIASIYNFENLSRSKISCSSNCEDAFIYNSLIKSESIESQGPSLIEGCCLDGIVKLGGENILTNIPAGVGNIEINKGLCITSVPVDYLKSQKGWVSIIYGIEDDFKEPSWNAEATFLNEPFKQWMEENGVNPSDIWEDQDPQNLWNARLFPFYTDPRESIRIAMGLQLHVPTSLLDVNAVSIDVQSPMSNVEFPMLSIGHWTFKDRDGSDLELQKWRESPRMSMQEILQSIDYSRFLENNSNLCRKIRLENLDTILTPTSDLSSEDLLSWCSDVGDYEKAVRITIDLIQRSSDMLFQARLYKLLSNILEKLSHKSPQINTESLSDILRFCENPCQSVAKLSESFEDKAFELIHRAIAKGIKDQLSDKPIEPKINIRPDEVVWVSSPARLDFAGGWTDTPPYCLEHGGSVLNASVKLNGQYPIQVIGKLHPEPYLKLNSIDLGQRVEIHEISDMLSYQDPSVWTSLPKAAFIAANIIPESSSISLKDIFKKLGKGIDLTLFSATPSGSGLGTSSILGAAIISCLSKMIGQELTHVELFNRTLYMEQLMTTGGGWQDQIGGVVGGIKIIQTEPSLFQVPKIFWTHLDGKSQILFYYTGMTRMAKNILRNIVGKYLDRDYVTLETLKRLQEKSIDIKESLDAKDIRAFGEKIWEVWDLNKTLDPGTSNDNIEKILEKISHLIYGAKLLGAGGGGFMFIVAKGIEEANEIRRILCKNPPNDKARFFDFDIDPDGLSINVL